VKIYYITYQDFPSNKANAQQTITTCKYFYRNKVDITLFFPLRSVASNDSTKKLEKFYDLDKIDFKVIGLKHFFKFEGVRIFKRLYFQFTQFMWAWSSINHIFKKYKHPDFVYTRSDWVLFLLSRKNFPVVFECHQLTKSRKIILKYCSRKLNTRLIFMNKSLLIDSGLDVKTNFLIQSNGFDEDFFEQDRNIKKIKNKIVFAGKLSRNNKQRGLKFIIDCFKDERLHKFQLQIIGDSDLETLDDLNKNSPSNVKFEGYLKKRETIKQIMNSEVGLLVNSSDSDHSLYHTDPLKYYEYSAADLKIVAPNFPSHKRLNQYNNLSLYEHENRNSFIETIHQVFSSPETDLSINGVMSANLRVINIIKFLDKSARLEGLEPPTL
jgi:glycosyltransferase involved in cell wall biosynthesis